MTATIIVVQTLLALGILFNYVMSMRHWRRVLALKDQTLASRQRIVELKNDRIALLERQIMALKHRVNS